MILCDDCKKSHRVSPATNNHAIERIEDIMSYVKSFLNKMTKEHDELISWSDRAILDDRRNKRISWLLFAVSAVMILVSVGLVSNLVSGMNPVEG